MATDQLEGRALDEAAARAMGCRFGLPPGEKCPKCGWLDPSVGCVTRCGIWGNQQVRGYSSGYSPDSRTLGELLEWFDHRGIELVIGSNPKADDWTKWEAEAIPDPPRQIMRAHGATIQQALARLVVAVGEEKP